MKKYLNNLVGKKKKKEKSDVVDFKTYNPEINKGIFKKKSEDELLQTLEKEVSLF